MFNSKQLFCLCFLLLAACGVSASANPCENRPQLQLINGSREAADVYWLKEPGERVSSGRILPGEETTIATTIGHRFVLVGSDSGAEVQVTSRVPIQAFRFDFEDANGIPAFYTQRAAAGGYPIVASANVNPYALREAVHLIDLMLAQRPDVRQAIIDSGSRLCILAWNEFTTDQPEFARLGAAPLADFPGLSAKDFWDARARGLGGSTSDPLCSCGEENLLCYDGDPYSTENILIHEFAHNIHLRGMVNVDPTFDRRLQTAYEQAMQGGLWKGKYASVNHHEYFAEGVQSWFDNNREPDHDHNHVNTRAELLEYDPGLAALCREVFGDTVLRYSKPQTRLTDHLQGYDPAQAPTFVWPERLQHAKRVIHEHAKARGAAASKKDQAATETLPEELLTVAEASGFEATGVSAEVNRFLVACDERAEHVVSFEFGRTSQGQPLVGAVIAKPGLTEPANDGRVVALLLGNIHSGECDGKEALLMLTRELALAPDHPWLKKLVIVVVPNYNADGNDTVSADNRPGQIGPIRGMGTRETAQGLDLNRDFMKLETPESQALVRLIGKWNPHLLIDCHTTNGSRHRYQLTYDIPHNPASAAPLRAFLRDGLIPDVTKRMKVAGYDTFYYGNFRENHTRWETYGFEPRYSTEYLGLRGRLGILSESYSYVDYRTRILATREFVRCCLDYATSEADRISALLTEIEDSWVQTAAAQPELLSLPLDAVLRPFSEKFTVAGLDGDSDKPRDYEVEFWGDYRGSKATAMPFAYLIPAELESVIGNLQRHGVRMERSRDAWTADVEVSRIESLRRSVRPFQGHQLVELTVSEQLLNRQIPQGTIIVRTSQPLGRLAAWLLEPHSVDGLATWNFLDEQLQEGGEFPILQLPSPSE
ncbi:MAG: hypothetical protein RL215_2909 [Planctomycetota bacterium]